MQTKIIEATSPGNWGKFMLGRFDTEWDHRGTVDPHEYSFLRARGWDHRHLWVMDLQTGEGALFIPGGHARNDLNSHKIWVCPLFEPFLTWLYQQDLTDLDALPDLVELLHAPFAWSGYRRPGPEPQEPGDE